MLLEPVLPLLLSGGRERIELAVQRNKVNFPGPPNRRGGGNPISRDELLHLFPKPVERVQLIIKRTDVNGSIRANGYRGHDLPSRLKIPPLGSIRVDSVKPPVR